MHCGKRTVVGSTASLRRYISPISVAIYRNWVNYCSAHRNIATMALSLSTNIVIISITFSVLAVIAVLLRFRARCLQKAKLEIDDFMILPGLVSRLYTPVSFFTLLTGLSFRSSLLQWVLRTVSVSSYYTT